MVSFIQRVGWQGDSRKRQLFDGVFKAAFLGRADDTVESMLQRFFDVFQFPVLGLIPRVVGNRWNRSWVCLCLPTVVVLGGCRKRQSREQNRYVCPIVVALSALSLLATRWVTMVVSCRRTRPSEPIVR